MGGSLATTLNDSYGVWPLRSHSTHDSSLYHPTLLMTVKRSRDHNQTEPVTKFLEKMPTTEDRQRFTPHIRADAVPTTSIGRTNSTTGISPSPNASYIPLSAGGFHPQGINIHPKFCHHRLGLSHVGRPIEVHNHTSGSVVKDANSREKF